MVDIPSVTPPPSESAEQADQADNENEDGESRTDSEHDDPIEPENVNTEHAYKNTLLTDIYVFLRHVHPLWIVTLSFVVGATSQSLWSVLNWKVISILSGVIFWSIWIMSCGFCMGAICVSQVQFVAAVVNCISVGLHLPHSVTLVPKYGNT
jgi:hypothetical protein